jgi:outer membrane lipoprotein-sorting protein
MENRSWVKAGLIVSLGLALSACAQQGQQAMMESEKGMMKTNQEMKNEDTMMKDNAGMMDKMGKDGNMKKEQMKDQNKDAM